MPPKANAAQNQVVSPCISDPFTGAVDRLIHFTDLLLWTMDRVQR
jgi:hypothetical protein